MPASSWPFPGEAPVARARRVALAYRSALQQHAPDVAASIDDIMSRWGETWATPRVITYGPDSMLSATEAGDVLCISAAAVHNLRRAGRLAGIKDASGRWHYRASNVTRLSAEPRRRSGGTTVTVSEDRRSAPK